MWFQAWNIDDATIAFLWFSISHYHDIRVKVNSGLIARKSMKILKIYKNIKIHKNKKYNSRKKTVASRIFAFSRK